MLSDKLVERLTMLGAMLDEEQRINNKLAYPLTRLLSVITTEGDAAWQSLQQEWQQEVECPDELLTSLRDYQKRGCAGWQPWPITVLAPVWPMTWVWARRCRRSSCCGCASTLAQALVVVPKSVVTNWQEEVARFAPELDVVVFENPAEREGIIREAKAGQVILINYGMLGSLAEALKSAAGPAWCSMRRSRSKTPAPSAPSCCSSWTAIFVSLSPVPPSRTIWVSCGACLPLSTRAAWQPW